MCLLLSTLSLALSFFVPRWLVSDDEQKNLAPLRGQAAAIRAEFDQVLSSMARLRGQARSSLFPNTPQEIFASLKKFNLRPAVEGAAYYDETGDLGLWLGNVIDLRTQLPDAAAVSVLLNSENSVLIQAKTSVYLVSSAPLDKNRRLVFYRLLAFLPQFKAPSLREYHFLPERLQKNWDIDYWDFREDLSGYEKIFSRHQDEFIGQPRAKGEIQTLFFPLRNERKEIVATVKISSLSREARVAGLREKLLLVFYLGLAFSFVLLFVYLISSPDFLKNKKKAQGVVLILALIGFRLLFFPLGQLEKVRLLAVFSPTLASFFSLGQLTKSPADIFLTSLILFLVLVIVGIYAQKAFQKPLRRLAWAPRLGMQVGLLVLAFFFVSGFQNILRRLVFNSNLNLFSFSFSPPAFLLHLSVLFLSMSLFLTVYYCLRFLVAFSGRPLLALALFGCAAAAALYTWRTSQSVLFSLLQIGLVAAILFVSFRPGLFRKTETLFLAFAAGTFFIYATLSYYTSSATRALLERSLRDMVVTQPRWADFLLRQSFPDIEKNKSAILSLLRGSRPSDLAHSVWEKTLAAKFNWYSSLEIFGPEGAVISSFSLNVPKLEAPDLDLAPSPNWSISSHRLFMMGKEKDFLVGHKDWYDGDNFLGRTVLSLSVDEDMLPFLYSANPYFELLRSSPLPSLNQIDFGFAIFDSEGQLRFNPGHISSGLSPDLLETLNKAQEPVWSILKERKSGLNALYFRFNDRIYLFYTPRKSFINVTVEYLKLFSLYLFVVLFLVFLGNLARRRGSLRSPLWSFSIRVYASFVAVALVPLVLFSFFTQNFFDRIFSQQYREEATLHAAFARSIMEDIVSFQQEEKSTPTSPPEDLVLWISSTIANDVNLYREGRMVSSSRRELFDSGLLPELIDGETYYKIRFENSPSYTQRQRIGDYSFQTTALPYVFRDSVFFISLPFPFEQQETARATRELIEFLIFISAFFIALVLIFARAIGAMIVTPIRKLLAGTKEVSLGNLEVSIEYRRKDEMKTLVEGFNTMIQSLKEHQRELAEMGKKVAWAEMARRVAHEIKNPLTPIQLSAEHLLRVYEDKKGDFGEALQESVSYITSEVENLRRIASEFMELSRDTVLQRELFDFKDAAQETLAPYKKLLSERITLREIYEGRDFGFCGDKSKIKVALKNIIINAIEAIRGQGEIEFKVGRKNGTLRIEISDTGVGMGKEMLERIFQPYFSTKEAGTGLGLPIAKKIIEEHGGSIQVASQLHHGTRIILELPIEK